MKIIKCKNPKTESHNSAMAVAFNLGSSVQVKEQAGRFFLLNWRDEILAVFESEGLPIICK